MKGLGNYRELPAPPSRAPQPARPPQQERKLGQLQLYRGDRATVRLIDGTMHTFPAAPFRTLGIIPEERFMLVKVFEGKKLVDVRIEKTEKRGAVGGRALPKVYVRTDGLKFTTRR